MLPPFLLLWADALQPQPRRGQPGRRRCRRRCLQSPGLAEVHPGLFRCRLRKRAALRRTWHPEAQAKTGPEPESEPEGLGPEWRVRSALRQAVGTCWLVDVVVVASSTSSLGGRRCSWPASWCFDKCAPTTASGGSGEATNGEPPQGGVRQEHPPYSSCMLARRQTKPTIHTPASSLVLILIHLLRSRCFALAARLACKGVTLSTSLPTPSPRSLSSSNALHICTRCSDVLRSRQEPTFAYLRASA